MKLLLRHSGEMAPGTFHTKVIIALNHIFFIYWKRTRNWKHNRFANKNRFAKSCSKDSHAYAHEKNHQGWHVPCQQVDFHSRHFVTRLLHALFLLIVRLWHASQAWTTEAATGGHSTPLGKDIPNAFAPCHSPKWCCRWWNW